MSSSLSSITLRYLGLRNLRNLIALSYKGCCIKHTRNAILLTYLGLRTVAKSEVAERFTGWDQLGGFAWARILSRRPEFADRCDWSKLKMRVWWPKVYQ